MPAFDEISIHIPGHARRCSQCEQFIPAGERSLQRIPRSVSPSAPAFEHTHLHCWPAATFRDRPIAEHVRTILVEWNDALTTSDGLMWEQLLRNFGEQALGGLFLHMDEFPDLAMRAIRNWGATIEVPEHERDDVEARKQRFRAWGRLRNYTAQ